MTFIYELGVLGAPNAGQLRELERAVVGLLAPFQLRLGREVNWLPPNDRLVPREDLGAAAVFFGGVAAPTQNLDDLLLADIPIIPVASSLSKVGVEIPTTLQKLNCLGLDRTDLRQVALSLLECVGLLPRQRRVFISYRRQESTEAALQLFSALSARVFEVFLDTHGVLPAEDFQSVLWGRLCDSDVVVMLDTATYFTSRWTTAEFSRALAKGISILRLGWPGVTASPRIGMAKSLPVPVGDLDPATGRLTDQFLATVCDETEALRGSSHAVRTLNMHGRIREQLQSIGGKVVGVGAHGAMNLVLADGRELVAYPTVKVPTSADLHKADLHAPGQASAVVYDAVGLLGDWIIHLDWLDTKITRPGWVKIHELGWKLADWNR